MPNPNVASFTWWRVVPDEKWRQSLEVQIFHYVPFSQKLTLGSRGSKGRWRP
jgi:hypothetical protein